MIKFFILAPILIDYDGEIIEEKLTIHSFGQENIFKQVIVDAGLKKLSGEIVHYHKTSQDILNVYDALVQERNLHPYLLKISDECIKDKKLIASLVVDENLRFLIVMEIECINYDQTEKFIYDTLKNRNPIINLGIKEWSDGVLLNGKTIALDIITRCSKLIGLSKPVSAEYSLDSFYPLIISDDASINGMSDIFINEENITDRKNADLCFDYKDAYLHIGWNYGISLGIEDTNVNLKIVSFLIFFQTHYYQMRFYKLYFLNKLEDLIHKNEMSYEDNEIFSKLKISYHKFTLNFMNYKTGLNPKYYSEFEKIENMWHLIDDMKIIDRAFEIQNERADKLYMATIEKDNSTQNLALKLITVLQVFGIYSIYFDGYELLNKNSAFFLSASILAITMCLSVVILLWKSTLKNMYVKIKYFKIF